jgi:hypothetical protein
MDELTSPERLRYFFGQMLGVDDFQSEQDYFVGKHRRHDRFLHGWGVVCGLGVSGGTGDMVTVEPGLAIDPRGREIVVPERRQVDPRVITDDAGEPTGAGPEKDAVRLCLAYAEDATDPVPVPEDDAQEFTRTAETYRLLVRDGVPPAPPRLLSKEQRDVVLSGPGPPAERLALASPEASGCSPPNGDCVVLATVTFQGDGPAVDPWTYRRQLFSVVALQELLFRLARRVSRLEEAAGL